MLPRYPTLYELNTRVTLRELSDQLGRPATLADIPDEMLDRLKGLGIDLLWLLGVWQTGEAGRALSLSHEEWRAEYQRTLPDFQEEDVAGSPFAIVSYTVHRDFGGNDALRELRTRLQARGIRLILDFVPNHTALDHPWATSKPDYYIQGTALDLESQPHNYTKRSTAQGPLILAHGRDPYFPGWPDTLQLDYRSPRVRAAMTEVLSQIAELCDGVRCDMAMLLLTDVFLDTWKNAPVLSDTSPDPGWDHWPAAISYVRQKHPEFLFIAEAYWDREWTLQQQGFSYTYDKKLYDRLLSQDAVAAHAHLWADLDYQEHSVRFLENHDEPRIAEKLPLAAHKAAAVITYFVPGLRFLHDGQLEGRKVKLSVHLGRRPAEEPDLETRDFCQKLFDCLKMDHFRQGDWQMLECQPAWRDNPTFDRFLVFAWQSQDANSKALVCVNYGPAQSQCFVKLRWPDLGGKICRLVDHMSDAVYDRPGYDLIDQGLYLDLPAWGFNVFSLGPLSH